MTEAELIEKVARAIENLMGPVFGSPEYLADPVKLARAEKRRADGAAAYAQAAIAAMREAMVPVGWMPIETAPKDGGYIVAARFEYGDALKWVLHSRWMTQEEAASEYGGDPSEYLPGWTAGENEDENCCPTHWMRLVPPETPLFAWPEGGA